MYGDVHGPGKPHLEQGLIEVIVFRDGPGLAA